MGRNLSLPFGLVFRLAGPRIDLAVRHFQSFIPNSGTIKETEDSTCMYAFKKDDQH